MAMSWHDQPPPRLSPGTELQLKQAFRANYPGELLTPDPTPGPRLLAAIFQMLRPENRLQWPPWTQIACGRVHNRRRDQRGTRVARSDMQILANFCWEEAPRLSESDLRPSPYKISNMLATRRKHAN